MMEISELLEEIILRAQQLESEGKIGLQKRGLDKLSEQLIYQATLNVLEQHNLKASVIYDESSHQFPDIVVNFSQGLRLGIEVKSSSSSGNSWRINGNSVLGSTSIEVDALYIIFVKLNESGLAIKFARYEDSIVDVVVTHSPRYLIDVMADPHESFFKRSGIDYHQLRQSSDPIRIITQYFKSQGKTAWWLGSSDQDDNHASATVLSWADLSEEMQRKIYGQAFVLFPELIAGNPKTKYAQLAKWLVAKHGVADTSLRDKFSAGGQVTFTYITNEGAEQSLNNAPHVFATIKKYQAYIAQAFIELPLTELQYYWLDYPRIFDGSIATETIDNIVLRKQYWLHNLSQDVKDMAQMDFLRHTVE